MKLSINILTWNCFNTLEKTFNLLYEDLKGIEYEIIVVDNGSTDETQKYMAQQTRVFKHVKYIYNPKNVGISAGKNQGINNSKGEYILMLDGDIVPVPGSIKRLLIYLNWHKHIDALGFYPDEWTRDEPRAETFCMTLFDVKPIRRACMYYGMYRRLIFDVGLRLDESGVFGEEGYGWEDHDFYETMMAMGIQQYVCHINKEDGKYYHEINSSIRQMGRLKYKETSQKRAKYFHSKWGD